MLSNFSGGNTAEIKAFATAGRSVIKHRADEVDEAGQSRRNSGVIGSEVQEFRRFELAFAGGKKPIRFRPRGALVIRPRQHMLHPRPFGVLQIDAGIKRPAGEKQTVDFAFLRERSRMQRILSAIDVDAAESMRVTFDPGETKADSAIGI